MEEKYPENAISGGKKRTSGTDKILFILMALIIAIMFAQVLFRYVFNHSLSWSEESAKFIFVWLVFLGAAVCIKERVHIGVEFLIERLSGNRKKYLELFNTLLIVLFNAAISIIGFFWVYEVSGTLSPAMELPLNIVFYAALPVAAVLSVIYGIRNIKEGIQKIKSRD